MYPYPTVYTFHHGFFSLFVTQYTLPRFVVTLTAFFVLAGRRKLPFFFVFFLIGSVVFLFVLPTVELCLLLCLLTFVVKVFYRDWSL